jgi:hypothetical protein
VEELLSIVPPMNFCSGAALWNYNTFLIFQSNERKHYLERKHAESALLHCMTYSAGAIDVKPSGAASRSIRQTMQGLVSQSGRSTCFKERS